MRILLVGCGKMGGAMLTRWKEKSLYSEIIVIEPMGTTACDSLPSAENIPTDFIPDIVIFAVKPQTLPDIISSYARFSKALFISIIAGKQVSFFEKALGAKCAIIRAMPNTPASIGEGITVACANKNVSQKDRLSAEKILGATGDVLWTEDEDIMNPVTALSGSGPAYVFLLIETLTAAGVKIGLSSVMAEKLARKTVIGSALLAKENADIDAGALRKNVTSPSGTTEAALKILMSDKDGIQRIFDEALQKATQRARELSE